MSWSDLLQVTELTQFLLEHFELLGENIPNLLDTDEGTLKKTAHLLLTIQFGIHVDGFPLTPQTQSPLSIMTPRMTVPTPTGMQKEQKVSV